MRTIDADALKELFSEVIGHIAKKPEMNGNLEHMIRASAMVIQMIDDAPTVQPDTTTHDSIPAETGKNNGDRTSGDCISRQQAIDEICEHGTDLERRGITVLAVANHKQATVDLLENLPSVQPERKTGRWLPDNTDYYRTKFICSACGESEEVPTTGFGYGTMWNYCPMCGAKMERRQDGQ